MKQLGIYQTIIPQEDVPYEGKKFDRMMIKNQNGYKLFYVKCLHGYQLVTDNANNYLPNNELYSKWEETNWFEDFIKENNIKIWE